MSTKVSILDLVLKVLSRKHLLVVSLLLLIAGSGISLSIPYFAGQFSETLLNQGINNASFFLFAILLLLIANALVGYVTYIQLGSVVEEMVANLRDHVYQHVQRLPWRYFQDHKRGEILSFMSRDAAAISDFVVGTLVNLLPQMLVLVGSLIMITIINKTIGIILCVAAPVLFLTMKFIGRKIKQLSKQLLDAYGKSVALVEENLTVISLIKSFAREEIEALRFNKSNQHILDLNMRLLKRSALLGPVVQLTGGAGIVALVWIYSVAGAGDEVAIGELVRLLMYGLLFTRPFTHFAHIYGEFQFASAASQRLVELLGLETEAHAARSQLPAIGGRIEFCNVTFGYQKARPIIVDLNLEIEPEEIIAITGENGVGKSTLANLLVRFIAPDRGKILMDGIDIESTQLHRLRKSVSVARQQVLLIEGNLRDNLTFRNPNYVDEELIKVLDHVGLKPWVEGLPRGLDTHVGENGLTLSGGERQRLSLARTLLVDAPVLVLDEATSQFDSEAEKQFCRNAKTVFRGKTVILITHQPAVIALADRVFSLAQGNFSMLR